MYKQKILNDFDEELFSTNYNDYATPTQNAKTDLLCEYGSEITFEGWLDELVDTFCRDNPQYTPQQVVAAINQEPKFLDDIREEFEYLKEELQDLFDEEDDDENEEEDED